MHLRRAILLQRQQCSTAPPDAGAIMYDDYNSPRQLAPRERLGLARSFAREIDATVGSAVASKPQLALEGLAWFQGDA